MVDGTSSATPVNTFTHVSVSFLSDWHCNETMASSAKQLDSGLVRRMLPKEPQRAAFMVVIRLAMIAAGITLFVNIAFKQEYSRLHKGKHDMDDEERDVADRFIITREIALGLLGGVLVLGGLY